MPTPVNAKPTAARIADSQALVDLSNITGYTADTLLRLRDSVNSYIDGAADVIGKHIELLTDELNQAEEQLDVARENLDHCLIKQRWDDESGCYVPSCSCKEANVERAEQRVNTARQRLKEATDIKSAVDSMVEAYRKRPGLISPGGGDYILEFLGIDHATQARDKLQQIIDTVSEYQTISMAPGRPDTSVTPEEPQQPHSLDERETRDRLRCQVMENEQQRAPWNANEINSEGSADRVCVCPQCKRPVVACICRK